MIFDQNSLTRTVDDTAVLPLQTLLHDTYRITEYVKAMPFGLIYIAQHAETAAQFLVLELFPETDVKRAEDRMNLQADDAEAYAKTKKVFLSAAGKLSAHPVPHLSVPVSFEQHGTAYCAFPWFPSTPLSDLELTITPTYLRSLGIVLCETYQALHALHMTFGTITPEDVCIQPDGTMFLHPAKIFQSLFLSHSQSLDMHCLVSFLTQQLEVHCPETTDAEYLPSGALLRHVLRYRYHDAALLKRALLCEDGDTEQKPQTARRSAKPLRRALVCLLFLLAGAAGIFAVGRNGLPLQLSKDLGLIRPDVISVWMPMDEWADEAEVQEMYHKLTVGFERKYPGYGVDLVIYADNSFSDALQFSEHDLTPPTVFMNSQDPAVRELAADLSPLLRSLEDSYLTDLTLFEQAVPLGCSLPALYSHLQEEETPETAVIEYGQLSSNASYDDSVLGFLTLTGNDAQHETMDFVSFLEDRNASPILASTSCLSLAERRAISSGTVAIQPVSMNGSYPLQYELYCSVNREKDWNSRCIGMLWLQYLLTEEAQQILFAEHYHALPLHEAVLPQTLENHEALSVVGEIQQEIDTAALQEWR